MNFLLEQDAMTTTSAKSFLTPTRILVPKLLKSRDGWKAKADQRKKKLKAAQIRIRDLQASRDSWKTKALHAEEQLAELRHRLEQLEHAPLPQPAPVPEGGPKKVPNSN
jgi:chromosome segregation ATPase